MCNTQHNTYIISAVLCTVYECVSHKISFSLSMSGTLTPHFTWQNWGKNEGARHQWCWGNSPQIRTHSFTLIHTSTHYYRCCLTNREGKLKSHCTHAGLHAHIHRHTLLFHTRHKRFLRNTICTFPKFLLNIRVWISVGFCGQVHTYVIYPTVWVFPVSAVSVSAFYSIDFAPFLLSPKPQPFALCFLVLCQEGLWPVFMLSIPFLWMWWS